MRGFESRRVSFPLSSRIQKHVSDYGDDDDRAAQQRRRRPGKMHR